MQDRMDFTPEVSSGFSLQEYAGILRRRRAVILQAFAITLVIGILVSLGQANVYQSGGKLLVEPPSYVINSISTSDPLADLFRVNAQYSLATQIELLQSSDMHKKVADKLGGDVPGFSIGAQEGTTIITVNAEGSNPDNVANAINILMDSYVSDVVDQSGKDLNAASKVTQGLADKADRDIEGYESKIQNFKQRHDVPEMDAARNNSIKTVNDLTTDYQKGLVEYQVLEARIKATEQQLANAKVKKNLLVNPLAALGVDNEKQRLLDPALQAVQAKIDDAKDQLSVLKSPEGDNGGLSKPVQTLNRQLAILIQRRDVIAQTMVLRGSQLNPDLQKLQTDFQQMTADSSAKAKELELLGQQLQAAKKRLDEFPTYEFSFADLQDRLANAKARSNNYHTKLYDLDLRNQTRRVPARVLERAGVPGAPVRPKRVQNILLAGVLGIFIGLCLAVLQELFDDRINSPEDAERALGVPNLGYIPMIEEEGLRLIRDISTFSPLMESYRTLRTNINFAAVGNDVKSLLVTSSVPAEGKSTTCANLAMAMALDGKRVVIVDADLRRPSQHKLFKVASSPGLTDILVGTHSIEDVLQPSRVEGVSVIPAGSPPPNPAELLGSAAMGHFLANIEAMADIVLFDSPPTLAVADAVVLASRVDGVLLVIGFGETKKTNTRQAKAIMTRANVHVLGTVLNRMVGPSSGYYYGKYYVPTIDTASLPGNGGKSGANGANGVMNGGAAESGSGRNVALLSEGTASTAVEDEEGEKGA